jgi:DNA-binding NarL/FixJ family response regulator
MQEKHATERITIVLADDHDLVRAGFRILLESMEGVEVVAEARDGKELMDILASAQEHPDLVITDLSMPGMSGLDALAHIRRVHPEVRCVVLTMDDSGEAVREALTRGAHAYLVKDASPRDLEFALRSVANGGTYFSAVATRCLLQPREIAASDELTPRQLEILTLLARGWTSKRVARQLGLSAKTVDVHRQRIMQRLQIKDVAGLTRYTIRKGLMKP